MKKQNVTIYDVAREAGVSMATVSRVVNGNMNVKPATREKVMEVIKRLDYHPNAVARGLASKRTRSVGVLIPDITNAYYSGLAQGINDIAAMYKYNIVLSTSEANEDSTRGVVSSILSRQVDGLIFIGHALPERVAEEVKRSRTPMVLADDADPAGSFPVVSIDNEAAFAEAVEHLIEEGRQRIAFVGMKEQMANEDNPRYAGYLKALKNHNLTTDDTLCYEAERLNYDNGYEIAQQLMENNVDAAVVVDDELALGILNAFQDQGIAIPEAFSLITANNTKLVGMSRPEISSIEPPIYDIGAVAMRVLTKLMDNDEETTETVYLPYRMIYRETTKS
ncbi:MAG: substrate-binding domain-containing protein [Aerococcus sp.]|nr:substrate-binding domain-containing protein [Aerococcus sp.]